jgi:hypothetical protein
MLTLRTRRRSSPQTLCRSRPRVRVVSARTSLRARCNRSASLSVFHRKQVAHDVGESRDFHWATRAVLLKAILILRTRQQVDCLPRCGFDSSRIARLDRPPGFFGYRSRQLRELRLVRIVRCKPPRCNLRGPCAPQKTVLTALLNRLPLWRLRRRADLQGQADLRGQGRPRGQAGRLRLWHLGDQVVPDHPLGQVFCHKPSGPLPRRSAPMSE